MNYPPNEIEFLETSLNVVVRCRQVLKYSYVYGYYNTAMDRKSLFEHQQTLLEEACELLHEQIEKPLDPFIDPNIPDRSPFYRYRSNVNNLADLT